MSDVTEYNEAGQIIYAIEDGVTYEFEYNEAGKLTKSSADGAVSIRTYYPNGAMDTCEVYNSDGEVYFRYVYNEDGSQNYTKTSAVAGVTK